MWILLSLLGMMAASGAGALMLRTESDDDTRDTDAPGPPTADDDGIPPGDILDFADLDGEAPVLPPVTAEDPEPDALAPVDPVDQDQDTGGLPPFVDDDEFISTDQPQPPHPDLALVVDDSGGAAAGGAGHDILTGGTGHDWLEGEDGDDQIRGGAGDDMLIGGNGNDTLLGGAGNDTLIGGQGNALLDGGDGDDSLLGGSDRDTLLGGAGDDTLAGGGGDDVLVAGQGADLLMGGDGDDLLVGADGQSGDDGARDTLNGGLGNDTLVPGAGDLAYGGEGDDVFVLNDWMTGGASATIADFTEGQDHIVIGYESDTAPQIDNSYDPQTGVLTLLANGEVIAVLPGVQSIPPESIILTRLGAG